MTAFVICVGSSLLSKTADVTYRTTLKFKSLSIRYLVIHGIKTLKLIIKNKCGRF